MLGTSFKIAKRKNVSSIRDCLNIKGDIPMVPVRLSCYHYRWAVRNEWLSQAYHCAQKDWLLQFLTENMSLNWVWVLRCARKEVNPGGSSFLHPGAMHFFGSSHAMNNERKVSHGRIRSLNRADDLWDK